MFERMKEKRNEGGFTLIELLIVIIILAILAAIVVFAVGGTSKNAAIASCNADAKSLETAVEAYKAQMGTYPPTANVLTGTTTDKGGNSVGPWLRSVPQTSPTGHYYITYDGSGGVFANGSNYDSSNACANAS